MHAPEHLSATNDVIASLNVLGESTTFRAFVQQVGRIARSDATVLIHGETGTGKELAARAMHYLSSRRDRPFIPFNCGSVPETLISSVLFGHARGAFTDAREPHRGLIAQADGGTLLLDELETMSARGQIALLRFLQDHEYRPLGAGSSRTADVRVIAATNADLSAMADRAEFRRDLLYRLNVLTLAVPPLRQRDDDVLLLAQTFLRRLAARYEQPPRTIHPAAAALLRSYDWPGNVRELENLVHREFVMSDAAELRFESLEDRIKRAPSSPMPTPLVDARSLTDVNFREAKARAVAEFERAYVLELLARAGGNVSLAARLAGKERSRLGRLIRKYNLSASEFRPDLHEQPRA